MTDTDYEALSKNVAKLTPSPGLASFEVLLQVVLLGSGLYLSSLPSLVWLLGQVILGVSFWRAFALLHSAGHGSLFRTAGANTLAGLLLSPFCLLPYFPWKFIHQDHHVWTGWIDRDPTTKALERTLPTWKARALNFCWRWWIPVISVHYIFGLFYHPRKVPPKKNRTTAKLLGSAAFVICAHLLAMLLLREAYLRYFGLAYFIYLNLGDVSLLTQHVHLPLDRAGTSEVKPKSLREQDDYSHTMLLPPFVDRWVALGFNHHALHHLFPNLPHYQLRQLAFQGPHTQDWKSWIKKAKSMAATDLLFGRTCQRN